MKKRIIFGLFLTLICIQFFAQEQTVKNNPEYDDKPIHFGYTLGLNVMDFSFKRNYPTTSVYVDIPSKTLGFQVGMICDLRLGEYFSLRALPSFNFGQRNLSFFENSNYNDNEKAWIKDSMKFLTDMKMESSMLDLPILLKYKAKRINNYRPYLIAGGSIRYDLASKSKFDDADDDLILHRPLDFYAEFGFGIDFYLPYFKMATELKFSLGLMNMLDPTKPAKSGDSNKYVESIQGLYSNIFMLSIHIE